MAFSITFLVPQRFLPKRMLALANKRYLVLPMYSNPWDFPANAQAAKRRAMAAFRRVRKGMVASDRHRSISLRRLANYLAAERSFRECLRLDAANTASRINLAMTLEEQARWAEALSLWQEVQKGPLSPSESLKVEKQIEDLRQRLAKPSNIERG
jgi:hypothetical protein